MSARREHSCSGIAQPASLTVQGDVTIIMVMAKKQPFALIYDPGVSGHLAAIETKYHSLIRGAIEEQLRLSRKRQPGTENSSNGQSTWGRGGNFGWGRTTAFASSIA